VHIPGGRNDQLSAAEDVGCINGYFISEVRLPEIYFSAAHKGHDIPAFQVFRKYYFFYASKSCGNVNKIVSACRGVISIGCFINNRCVIGKGLISLIMLISLIPLLVFKSRSPLTVKTMAVTVAPWPQDK
jgi:hypothetical protein